MSPLQSRKQLLLAESELNRALLVMEVAGLKADIRTIADRAKSVASIASSVAALLAGLAALKRGKPAEAGAKRSWLHIILEGAGLISTFWLACRPRLRDRSGD